VIRLIEIAVTISGSASNSDPSSLDIFFSKFVFKFSVTISGAIFQNPGRGKVGANFPKSCENDNKKQEITLLVP